MGNTKLPYDNYQNYQKYQKDDLDLHHHSPYNHQYTTY